MRNSLSIVIALLAGLVLGNWGVKSDLRKARKEAAEFREELNRRTQRQEGVRGITSMLRVPEPTRSRRPAAASPAPDTSTNTAAAAAPATTNAPASARSRSFGENIQEAVELWKTRSALARTSFISNVGATPVQTQMFDQTVEAMNKELGDKIQQWADYVKQQKTFSPETGLRMMNDLSSTLVKSYDELDRAMPADWRDRAGQEFQLFDFINPEVALPLADIENFPQMGRRGR
jgi:hypothetical protein